MCTHIYEYRLIQTHKHYHKLIRTLPHTHINADFLTHTNNFHTHYHAYTHERRLVHAQIHRERCVPLHWVWTELSCSVSISEQNALCSPPLWVGGGAHVLLSGSNDPPTGHAEHINTGLMDFLTRLSQR